MRASPGDHGAPDRVIATSASIGARDAGAEAGPSSVAMSLAAAGWGLGLPPELGATLRVRLLESIERALASDSPSGSIEVARSTPLASFGPRRLVVEPDARRVIDSPCEHEDVPSAGLVAGVDAGPILTRALIGLVRHDVRAPLVRGHGGLALARRGLTSASDDHVIDDLDVVEEALAESLTRVGELVEGLDAMGVGRLGVLPDAAHVPDVVALRTTPSTLVAIAPHGAGPVADLITRWCATWWQVDHVVAITTLDGPPAGRHAPPVARHLGAAAEAPGSHQLDPAAPMDLQRRLGTAMRRLSIGEAMTVLDWLLHLRSVGGSLRIGASLPVPVVVLATDGSPTSVPVDLEGIVAISR